MDELAICNDFLDVVVEQVLAVLLALGCHLIFEVINNKCERLVLVVPVGSGLCVLTQNLE